MQLQPTHPQFVPIKEQLDSAYATGDPILYISTPTDPTALSDVQIVSSEHSDKRHLTKR